MKIEFIFGDDKGLVDVDKMPLDSAAFMKDYRFSIASRTVNVFCPVHKENSWVKIGIFAANNRYGWQFMDWCCDGGPQAIVEVLSEDVLLAQWTPPPPQK